MPEKKERECKKHGLQLHYHDKSSRCWRCPVCNKEKVMRRHKKVKRLLVEYKGGECEKCGYKKCMAALQFHHIDPSTKSFGIAQKMYSTKIDLLKKEVDKCKLLCANCHFEEHSDD